MVAEFCTSTDDFIIATLTDWLEKDKPELPFVMFEKIFDGTSHKVRSTTIARRRPTTGAPSIADGGSAGSTLALPTVASTSKRHSNITCKPGTVKTLVSEISFTWMVAGCLRPFTLEMTLPPYALPGSGGGGAKELWRYYKDLPGMEKVNRLYRAFMDASLRCGGWALDLMNTDDASDCDLYSAAEEFASYDAEITHERGVCLNHQCQHTIIWAITVNIGLKHISTYYACTTFIGTGTHLYRFNEYFEKFVSTGPSGSRVVFFHGDVPEHERRYTTSLIDILVANYDGPKRNRSGYVDRLNALFNVWNGGFFEGFASFRIYIDVALDTPEYRSGNNPGSISRLFLFSKITKQNNNTQHNTSVH